MLFRFFEINGDEQAKMRQEYRCTNACCTKGQNRLLRLRLAIFYNDLTPSEPNFGPFEEWQNFNKEKICLEIEERKKKRKRRKTKKEKEDSTF